MNTTRHKGSTIKILNDGSCLLQLADKTFLRCHNIPTAKFFINKEVSMKNRNNKVDLYRAVGASLLGMEFKNAIVLIGSSFSVSKEQYVQICKNTKRVLKGYESGSVTLEEFRDELQNFTIVDSNPSDILEVEAL
jgi:hypothetical protein